VKPGTYIEHQQMVIPEYVSLIGDNVVVKFDRNPDAFPENVCVMLNSNVSIHNIEFIFDKIQDLTKNNIAIASSNYLSTFEENVADETYFDGLSTITSVELFGVKITITDDFINQDRLLAILFIKTIDTVITNSRINITHAHNSGNILYATIVYNKLSEINYNSLQVDINGTTTASSYIVFANDASNSNYNNPDVLVNLQPSEDSTIVLILTVNSFITTTTSPNLSPYNTLCLGGTMRAVRNDNFTSVNALYADYNSTLIAANMILEGDASDRNNPQDEHPNSLLKTMNCVVVSKDGNIISNITELSIDGGKTIDSNSLHVGHLVGVNDNIPFNNVLVGVRVATLNTAGNRNTMIGVNVGTKQVSGNDNVYFGYATGRNALQSDNVFIGSNVATELETGSKNVFIGKDTGSNADIVNKSVLIGHNTGKFIQNLEEGIIIGDSSMNMSDSATMSNILVIGSNGVGDSLVSSSKDIIMGNYTASSLETTSESILMGHNTGTTMTEASKSIIVGNNTGTSIDTAENTIIIGNENMTSTTGTAQTKNNLVVGNRALKNATTAKDNIVMGNGAGRNITTGSRNVILGQEEYTAGNTTSPAKSLTTGSDSVIIGSNVATGVTTGSRNFVVGNNSGNSMDLTSDTIILGYNSGNNISGGNSQDSQNIIIGNETGKFATSGKVIMIGHEAGQKSSGVDSLIIGNRAGRTIAGPRNTIIGNKAAGISNDENNPVLGQDNVVIGTFSGFQLTTGSYNIVLGSGDGLTNASPNTLDNAGAGYSLKSGDKNFIAGFNAGRKLQSGSENILLGSQAGAYLGQSNRNVLIGNNAGLKLGANDSQEANSENNVIIGNEAGENITLGNDLLILGRAAAKFSTQGQQNTYIGNYTGQVNNGSRNTFIGNRAGFFNKGDDNTIIGTDAGRYSETSSFNTLIGFEAGRGASELQKNVGDFNTAIGYQAGQELTTGYRNLYLGFQAGQLNKEGAKNIMIGPNAGLNSRGSKSIFIGAAESNSGGIGFNTTGELNLVVGIDSGVAMTSGTRNVLLGSYAGQNVTTASSTVLIGTDAGQNITTGSDNILIGPGAGRTVVTGENNIMIGDRAGNEATNGSSENILIGTLAGSKTEINESINIGNKAGQNNQTGTGNILIGRHAGQKFEQSCNNIMIGSNAGASFYPTGSNIALGENIYIGPEVGRDNITGIRNIVMGTEAFKSSVQGSGIIAIGYKAASKAGILEENVGGKLYENTIIGFEAGSQGDYANQNVMIGSKVGRNVNNPFTFEGNILLGADAGINSNLSVNSIVLGNANKIGSGGINNVIAGTSAGDNLGQSENIEYEISNSLNPGDTILIIQNITYGDFTSKIQIGDKVIIYNLINTDFYKVSISYIENIYNTSTNEFEIYVYLSGLTILNTISNVKMRLVVDVDDDIGQNDNTKSSSNTILGNEAGKSLTIGSKNVTLGDKSMHENKIGKYNNMLGTLSGYYTRSDNNTFLGTKAGFSVDNFNGPYNGTRQTDFTEGFYIEDNTIYVNGGVNPDEYRFGTVIELENTTSNDEKRFKVFGSNLTSITVEGFPKIDKLGVEDFINPNYLILNDVSFNFTNFKENNVNAFSRPKKIFIDYYETIISSIRNPTNDIGQNFFNKGTKIMKIQGSKFNDGIYYLYKINDQSDLEEIKIYQRLYPEIFEEGVVSFESTSITSINDITQGVTFQDFLPNNNLFTFFGNNKGVYYKDNIPNQSRFINFTPINNSIYLTEIANETINTTNNIFTIGHIQNFTNSSFVISKYIYYFDQIEITSDSTIIFSESIDLQLSSSINLYLQIEGTINNNKLFKIVETISPGTEYLISSLTNLIPDLSEDIIPEIAIGSISNPIIFKYLFINNISKELSSFINYGNIINLNINHSLGQKTISGAYLVNYFDSGQLMLDGDQKIPRLTSSIDKGQNNIHNNVDNENINFKINKSQYNIDIDYMNNHDNHLHGYDLMFQTGFVPGPFTTFSSNNTIHTDTMYGFKDIIAPCMIELDDNYHLVKSNKYPFKILDIDTEHSSLNDLTINSNINFNSISCYQNYSNLSLLEQGVSYKILGGCNNNDINITPVNDTTAITKKSVYLTENSNIVNYQGNNKLMVVDYPHEDFDTSNVDIMTRGFGRGYFKHFDFSNVNIMFNNLETEFEKISILNKTTTSQKEYLFIPDNIPSSKKYNLIQLADVTSFESITEPDNLFNGNNELNTINLSNTYTYMNTSYNTFKISTHGYLLFENNAHSHVYNFMNNYDVNITTSFINNTISESNIRTKIIDSDTGNSDILQIDFTSYTDNDSDYTGINNCQMQLFLNNSDHRKGRIYTKYSNISIDNLKVGLDSTSAIVKENRVSTLINNNDYKTPIINLNQDNYENFNNKKISLVNNNILIGDLLQININDLNLTSGDQFGNSVAMYGDYLVIGSPYNDNNVNSAGSVFVFKKDSETNTYSYVDKLIGTNPGSTNRFGSSVAIYEDFIVVGSPFDDDNQIDSGTVYVFKRDEGEDTFTQVDKLFDDDPSLSDNFGTSVAIYDIFIAVGNPNDDEVNTNSGSVTVFKKNDNDDQFSQVDKLYDSNPGFDENFGTSVAIYDVYVVVGTPRDNDSATFGGSVSVFKKDNIIDQYANYSKIIPSNVEAYDKFGISVSIYGDYIAIGSSGDNDNGPSSGSVYIYKNDQVNEEFIFADKITASDASGGDNFGQSVYIYNDFILVGAPNDDETENNSGAAFLYLKDSGADTFSEIYKITPDNTGDNFLFGYAVTIYDDTIFIASPNSDYYQGSVYYLKLDDYEFFNNSSFILNEILLSADDGGFYDQFGASLATYGDYLVVGTTDDDDTNGGNSGSVYVFKKNNNNGFDQIAKLIADDAEYGDLFGNSVSMYGDYIVIGSKWDDDNGSASGSAYVFKNDGNDNFDQIDKLTVNDGSSGDQFGISVAIYGDYIVVGAYKDDVINTDSGSAYVFVNDGNDSFVQIQKLSPNDAAYKDNFGNSVAMYGNYIVIGAYKNDDNGTDSGSVYVFKNESIGESFNIIQIAKLNANDGSNVDIFGNSVAIYDNYIVVGAYLDDDSGLNSGSVYVFKNDGNDSFDQIAKLTANDGAANDNFGYSVSIYGDYIVIGSIGDDDNGSASGSAYVFKNDGNDSFDQIDKLSDSDGSSGDFFGTSVAINDNFIFVSSPNNTISETYDGSVYVFNYNTDILKNYIYSISDYASEDIDTSLHTQYSSSQFYSSEKNIIIGNYQTTNLYINKNGYIKLNSDIIDIFTENSVTPVNNYLTVLNSINFDNIYIRNNDNIYLSIVFEKNDLKIIETIIYQRNRHKIEFNLINLNSIFTSHHVKSTVGVNLFNYNEYENTSFDDIDKKAMIFNKTEDLNNSILISPLDIIKFSPNYYQVIANIGGNITVKDTNDYEVINNLDVKINQYVAYDEINQSARVDFEKIRNMVGEHSNFLRFGKLRDSNYISNISNNGIIKSSLFNALNVTDELTNNKLDESGSVNNYPNLKLIDKTLNYSVDTSVITNEGIFDPDIFTVQTTYILPIKEEVPNEYFGHDTANLELRTDYYSIFLGEPVFDFAGNTQIEIQNINTPPKGFYDIFINDEATTYDKIIFNSENKFTGNITINSTNIVISEIELINNLFILDELNSYSGINDKYPSKPFINLKPGNQIYISYNNKPINSQVDEDINTSIYYIKEYSQNDGLIIDIDTRFNTTTLNKTAFNSDDAKLKIELAKFDDNLISGYDKIHGHIINERLNFGNFSNVNIQPVNPDINTSRLLAIVEFPVLNFVGETGTYNSNANFINYSIPEWGIRPYTMTTTFDNTNQLSTLDFFYSDNTASINTEDVILDSSDHICIIPNSNISINLVSTNLSFKSDIITNKNIIIDVDNLFIEDNSGGTIDFTSFNLRQLFKLSFTNNGSDFEFVLLTDNVKSATQNRLFFIEDDTFNFYLENVIPGASPYEITNANIVSNVILSTDLVNTDLSNFNPGNRIKISNTESNNGIFIIDPKSYTTRCCLLINQAVNETPTYCLIENIVLQKEIGIVSSEIDVDEIGTKLTITEESSNEYITFNNFTTDQIVYITDEEGNYDPTSEFQISSTVKPTNTEIKFDSLSDGTYLINGTSNLSIIKKLVINLIGEPILSSIGQASLYHFVDAQGNNMMLGSFTGQFCGSKNHAIHNTFIGNKVGQTNHGSGNVFFGSETALATNSSQGESFYNNKFAIYKNNFVGVPNNPLIGGDFGSGRVGINTINPDELLGLTSLETSTRLVINGSVLASSYTPFTGSHIITLSKNTKVSNLLPGLILSSTGNMKKISITDTIVECELTEKEKDKKVFGIYSHSENNEIIKDNKKERNLIHYVAGVGEGQIWVSNIAGDVEAGDYVCSSSIPGYTQLQDDDLAHNYTVAKITEDIDWDKIKTYKSYNKQSYKVALLGCVYMCS
jgi:hypothetical protein